MFWSKKERTEIPKQTLILKTYLGCVMPLMSEEFFDPTARAAIRIFILGMVDMVRQTYNLSWEQFVAAYETILTEYGLQPSGSISKFVSNVAQIASTNEDIEKVMMNGAQSLRMYVVELDANAPMDLLGAIAFAENKASSFSELGT